MVMIIPVHCSYSLMNYTDHHTQHDIITHKSISDLAIEEAGRSGKSLHE